MKADEKVAVLTALQKLVKNSLNEARAEADAELLRAYEEEGVQKKALKLDGVKVGDYLVMLSSDVWQITDQGAFNDFALSNGLADIRKQIKPEYLSMAIKVLEREFPEVLQDEVVLSTKWKNALSNVGGVPHFMDTKVVVPGVAFCGQQVKNTQVRGCSPDDVAPLLRRLGGIEALLLDEAKSE